MREAEGQEEPGDAVTTTHKLEAILGQRMLGICFWTADGRITHANDAFLDMLGTTQEELRSGALNWRELTPPEHLCRDEEALCQIRATGTCAPFEKDYVRRDGTRIHVLIGGSSIGPDHGVSYIVDITARKRAEEALKLRERELAEAQHLARMGTWRWDIASDTLTFSDELYAIYGRSPSEVRHTIEGGLELVHPDDRPNFHAALAGDLRNPPAQSYRTLRPGGEVRYLTSTARAILDGDRVVGLAGVVQDVTERTLAEDELRRSEERFRTLVERIPVGVVVTNGRGEIVLANPAALEISQLPHAQLVGRSALDPAWDAIHDDGTPFPANEQPVAKAIATRQAVRNVVIGVRAHLADRLWLLSSAEPQLGPEGEVRQVVVSFMNITERRGIQARLALADRMVSVGTLAAGVAHEINNPLAYVIANLGYIAHDLERRGTRLVGAGPLVAAVNEAREGAERVRSIVRDLRTFSRGDEDRRGPVDVKRVVDSAISLVWNQIRHAARLTLDIGALPLVHANESRLAQVFVSLLVNAAQAMDGGDSDANQIRVVGKSDAAGRVVLEVADTGVGISPEDLKRVFDPFFTTKPLGMAAGLGLSICQGIIGELGGEITVESEPGKGSTFRVILPPLEAVRIAAERPPTEAGTSGRGRVLVIDDEAAIGSAIQRMLEDEHDVVFATGGAQALELLAHDAQFDAVLCDLLMPHMPGMEFFARLREAHPRLAEKTVFLTGGAFTPAAREFLDRTPNRVVEKPFDFDRLRALVAVVVKGE